MTECIHGLDFELCDICSPKKAAPPPPRTVRAREPRPVAARALRGKVPQRLHVVLSLDEFADALADGVLVTPTYYVGPEEVGWTERRRAPRANEQVVLVVAAELVHGLDDLPLGAVQLVAVASTLAQERARELLALTSFAPKVVIHPPWFTTA